MSNLSHAFENLLSIFMNSEPGDDFITKWKEYEKDWNFEYLTEEQIDTIEECGIYIFNNLFEWDREWMREVWEEREWTRKLSTIWEGEICNEET